MNKKNCIFALIIPFVFFFFSNTLLGNDLNETSSLKQINNADCRLGIAPGGVSDEAVKQFFPNSTLVYFSNPLDPILALDAKKIDAYIYESVFLVGVERNTEGYTRLPIQLASAPLVIAAKHDRSTLMRKVNEFIRENKANGVLEKMEKYWLDGTIREMPVIQKPEKTTSKIKVGCYDINPPWAFRNDKNEVIGYEIEFLQRLSLYLNAEIEFSHLPFGTLLTELKTGKIDLMMSSIQKTEERSKTFLLSDPYIDKGLGILIRTPEPEVQEESMKSFFKALFEDIKVGFQNTFLTAHRWTLLVDGLITTLTITISSVILGSMIAFPIYFMRSSKKHLFQNMAKIYVSIMQGTPILVTLMALYYVVFRNLELNAIVIAVIAFSLNSAAYISEMLRSGIEAIPKGQKEAGLSLGLTIQQAFWKILMPQALIKMLPVYRGEIIGLLKSTSLVGYIAITDLTKMADIIRARTYEAFFPLLAIAITYYFISTLISFLLTRLENKLRF